MMIVKFMSTSGAFKTEKELKVANKSQALFEVTEFYHQRGFSDFKLVEDEEMEGSYRITAKTPGGRAGRNVAFVEEMGEES